ncbi:MAG: alpha/beta hydrolase, partial [Actinobacteria bacterium]|nr:alpha/beta hydrolase [Actinomycetota bacterium]
IGNTAHCALEYHRWAWRSYVRADGRRFNTLMAAEPIQQPVLHIHGRQDPTVLAATTTGSGDYVAGPYDLAPIDECGHFPHEERPEVVLPMLLEWLAAHG